MKKTIPIFLVIILLSLTAATQDSVPELITDRPDQTESSSLVPNKMIQIETGFVFENNETSNNKLRSYAYNTSLLRYGLMKNLELRMGLEYLGDIAESKSSNEKNSTSGFSPLYVGFKTKIIEEKDCMPEIAFLGAMTLPFSANENYKPSNPAANMRFAFSHTLSDQFSLGYNLGAEWDGDSTIPGYFYSLALGIGLSQNLGMFIESYGLMMEDNNGEHLLDTGFTYLIMPNIQIDISGGLGLNSNAIDHFISAGISIRLPR